MPGSHYVPVLKSKDGECKSLRDLDGNVRSRITPLIEITRPGIRDWQTRERYALIDHLEKTRSRIADGWPSHAPIFVDFADLDPTTPVGRTTVASWLFANLEAHEINFVPVSKLGETRLVYQDAVRNVVVERGVCIRITERDFDPRSIAAMFGDRAAFFGVDAGSIDVVIDVGSISDDLVPTMVLAAQTVIAAIPDVERLRSLTLAASGFPQHLGGCRRRGVTTLARPEWTLWREFYKSRDNLRRLPQFGDYAVAHPTMIDFDPFKMRMSAAIRYTTETGYVVAKGHAVDAGDGWEQTTELASWIASIPEFKGADFSWGDAYIEMRARGNARPGGPSTWRRVGTTHHVTLVADMLARLPVA